MADTLWNRGAGELARMIRSGEVSSTEVIEAHLARIDAVNPELNAVVVVLAEEALAAAKEADRRIAAGDADLGPLHGVPVTVKENIDVAGTSTTKGVAAFAAAVPAVDAPLVERLRAAGAIVIGRTNMPDMGLRVSTDSSLRGLTRNPWHAGVTAGGSSGGEASALAAGMSALGAGNDIGGSLRNPAHCCGISALKPTPGRVPWADATLPEDWPLSFQLMAVHGPMARRVADVRLGLEIMAGPDRRDPGALPVPLTFPDSGGPVRVALLPEPPGVTTNPAVAEMVRRAGAHLAAAGYEVEEATPPEYEAVRELWGSLLMTELESVRPLLENVMGADGLRMLHAFAEIAPQLDLDAYIHLFVTRRRLARLWQEFFQTYPVVLSPVWPEPAFPHGWDLDNPGVTLDVMRPIMPANALGLPAVATPGGVVGGLPVGVQLIGAPFREDRVLDAAAVIETAVGMTGVVDPFAG
ncbi:amidase [Nocardia puris]|uniref:amidase n=1 Tax=Nocardia puris TaxID=208602 RepID=A0A366D9A9_9NOCA|nr:amidase [Nocardia puris]RBO86525.1 amidase [Nocardia puris]